MGGDVINMGEIRRSTREGAAGAAIGSRSPDWF